MDMKSEEDYDGNYGIIEMGCIWRKIIISDSYLFNYFIFINFLI